MPEVFLRFRIANLLITMRKYEKQIHMRKNSGDIGTVVALYVTSNVMKGVYQLG